MNGYDPTTTSPPATMRDIRALRSDLVEVAEEAARATLAAHTRTLALLDEQGREAAAHRGLVEAFVAEQRAVNATLTKHLSRLVDVPGERETLSPPTWQGRLATWLARPASTRAVLALAAAGVLATLSGCVALMGVH